MNTPTISNIQFVFDVESIGLHGEPFAVGYVIYEDGKLVKGKAYSCPRSHASGDEEDRKWVEENCPPVPITHHDIDGMLRSFWHDWLTWKQRGAQLFAECAWPVEAKFLAMCIGLGYPGSKWDGPYPLHEIASFMAAAGMDPMASYPYEEGETKHDPLSDARQSARLLRMAIEKLTVKCPDCGGTDDGGPAFPQPMDDMGTLTAVTQGMSLRDYFAGQALSGILSDPGTHLDGPGGEQVKAISEQAYYTADAMLKARNPQQP